MIRLRDKLLYKLYLHLSKVISHNLNIERQHKFCSCAKLDPSARIFPEAVIDNFSDNPNLIQVGENSVVRGQLLIFAHEGCIDIGKDCYVGEGARIWSAASIKIGDRVLISHNVNIHDTNAHPIDPVLRHQQFMQIISVGHPKENIGIISKPILIEDDAWIGFNSIILKGVTIGRGAIVGAGSVVTKDVPEASVVVGNPARVIREYEI